MKRIRQNELDAPAMEEKRRLFQQILDAYEVYAAWKLWDAAQKRLTETSQALSAQRSALPELTKAQTAAQGEKAAADTRAEEMLKAYSLVEERVSKALTLFREITQAEADQQTAIKAQKTAKAAEAKAQQALTDLEEDEKGWRKTEAELQGVPLKVQQCNQKKTEANGIHADISEIKKQSAEIIRQEADANQAANQFVRAKNAYEEKNQEYQQKQEAFLNAQAGFLAREKLQPGKPCPVCGSTVHPQPCTLSEEHRELNRELIEKLKTETDRLQAQMSDASRVSGEMAVHLNGLRTKRQEAMDKLRERMAQSIENLPAEWNLDTAREALSGWVKKIAAESETLTKQNDRLAAVQKQLAGVEQQRRVLRTDADKKRSAAEKAVQAVTAAQTRLAELLKNKQYETPESARAELQKAAAERDATSAEQKEKENKANSAADTLTKATTLIGEYESKLPALRQESTNSETAYQSLLFAKHLSEESWKKTVTEHRKDEAEQLTNELKAFDTEKSSAQQQKETAEKLIGSQERPDLAALSQQKQEAQENHTAVAEKLNQLTPLLKLNSEVLQKLEKQMQERMQALHAFEQLRSIYTRLSGNVSGAKMDIETFAQRYYLKRILHHANRRFTTMTAGQFEMRLCDMEQAGKGTNHGLDLTVYSFVTQKTRDIRTLSGGESFMAALSLALGMADQIQESSSAVHLDMMFIDEGFGSLSENALNQAIDLLNGLADGKRLIGVISHVSELKSRIPNKLIVRKTPLGSNIETELG